MTPIELIIWIVLFTVLTTAVLILRFWSNYSDRKGVRLPDYLAIIAYISLLADTGTALWNIISNLNTTIADLDEHDKDNLSKFYMSAFITWLISTSACKLSMLTLYLTLFGFTRRLRVLIYITCAMTVAYFIVTNAVLLTRCYPTPSAGCQDTQVESTFIICVNIILDITIAVLPVPILWKSRMPLHQKVAIAGMVLMGLTVVGALIGRLYTNITDHAGCAVLATKEGDCDVKPDSAKAGMSAGVCLNFFFGVLEIWLSVIVISLPSIAPLFRRHILPYLSRCGLLSHNGRRAPPPSFEGLAVAAHTIGGTPQDRQRPNESQSKNFSLSTTELVDRSQEKEGFTRSDDIRLGRLSLDERSLR